MNCKFQNSRPIRMSSKFRRKFHNKKQQLAFKQNLKSRFIHACAANAIRHANSKFKLTNARACENAPIKRRALCMKAEKLFFLTLLENVLIFLEEMRKCINIYTLDKISLCDNSNYSSRSLVILSRGFIIQ